MKRQYLLNTKFNRKGNVYAQGLIYDYETGFRYNASNIKNPNLVGVPWSPDPNFVEVPAIRFLLIVGFTL